MQPKHIASGLAVLAITGLSGAALAQSNATVYGTLLANFDVIDISGGAANTPRFNRVSSNGSLLGFKGSEALGNGLTAMFQLETNMNVDDGSTTLFGTARNTFVGLSGAFGTFKLGNFEGPSRAFQSTLDVNVNGYGPGSNSGIGTGRAMIGRMGGLVVGSTGTFTTPKSSPSTTRSSSTASPFDIYLSNAASWTSPKISGFQFTGLYAANENKDDSSAGKINTSIYDLGLTYDNGPVLIGLTHGEVLIKNQDDGTAAAPTISERWGDNFKTAETRLGGKYNFNNGWLSLIWSHNRTHADANALPGKTAATNGLDLKQNVWGVGAAYNVTPSGKLIGQYYRANDISGSLGNGTKPLSDTGGKMAMLGYEHSLSKRTMIRLVYARVKNDSNAGTWNGGYDFGNLSSGFAGANRTISGFETGLRHTF